jgi:hypothetical protein
LIQARRWPLPLTEARMRETTGDASWAGALDYFCNNSVDYTLRGARVHIQTTWEWQAPAGRGDVYEASFRGTKAMVDVRQGEAENHRPEVYVTPADKDLLRRKTDALQTRWPGLELELSEGEARFHIPDRYRVGHEAHFAQVRNRFFEYLDAPATLPKWERPCMLAKYFVSTKGVELARQTA